MTEYSIFDGMNKRRWTRAILNTSAEDCWNDGIMEWNFVAVFRGNGVYGL